MFKMSKTCAQELNKIAIPLIIQNISSYLIGFVDEMFIGRISTDAYGAIGVAASLMFFIAGVFGYTAVAFNISGSRKMGEGDVNGFKVALMASLLIDMIIGIAYAIVVVFGGKYIFSTAYGLSGEALQAAMTYIYILTVHICCFKWLSLHLALIIKLRKRQVVLCGGQWGRRY